MRADTPRHSIQLPDNVSDTRNKKIAKGSAICSNYGIFAAHLKKIPPFFGC